MDFVKDQEELFNKTSEYFKDKARNVSRSKPSVKMCKTWFDSQRTRYGKMTKLKSVQALKEMMKHQTWIQDN